MEKCDSVHDLKIIREGVKEKITKFRNIEDKQRLSRFSKCEPNYKDNEIIEEVVSQERDWMYNNVYNGLDMRLKIWYHTSYKFDKFMATIKQFVKSHK